MDGIIKVEERRRSVGTQFVESSEAAKDILVDRLLPKMIELAKAEGVEGRAELLKKAIGESIGATQFIFEEPFRIATRFLRTAYGDAASGRIPSLLLKCASDSLSKESLEKYRKERKARAGVQKAKKRAHDKEKSLKATHLPSEKGAEKIGCDAEVLWALFKKGKIGGDVVRQPDGARTLWVPTEIISQLKSLNSLLSESSRPHRALSSIKNPSEKLNAAIVELREGRIGEKTFRGTIVRIPREIKEQKLEEIKNGLASKGMSLKEEADIGLKWLLSAEIRKDTDIARQIQYSLG